MNNKAQISVGTLIMVFVAIVAALAMYTGGITSNIGSMTNTVAVANASLGVASNSTTVYLTSYKSISDVVVINNSNGAVVPATNYTVTNNVVYNGQEAVSILPKATADYRGYQWNISGTAQPLTYDTSSGGRAVTNMIAIFAVLAVGVVALWPVFGSKILESIS